MGSKAVPEIRARLVCAALRSRKPDSRLQPLAAGTKPQPPEDWRLTFVKERYAKVLTDSVGADDPKGTGSTPA